MSQGEHVFEKTTRGVNVRVRPEFCRDRSEPESGNYFWLYTIVIENTAEQDVQLVRRHWEITDGRGAKEVVDGAGVVGEQPVLSPGDTFQYTSGVPLGTPTGFMGGHYTMRDMSGGQFSVAIPMFSLDSPFAAQTMN